MTRRRALLGGIVGTVASLAGCFGDPESGASPSTGTESATKSPTSRQPVFESVEVAETTLVVELRQEVSVSKVNVVAPDGTPFASKVVPEGATTVEVEVGFEYDPGEYRVVAVDGERTVEETSLEISPEIEITEVGIGANNLDRMPEELGNTKASEALIEIENTGNGPEEIEKLLLLGDLPNPTTELKNSASSSGIFDADCGQGEVESIRITGGETLLVFTSTLPFSFQGDGIDCTSDRQRGVFDVILEGRVSRSSATYEIQYTASAEYNGCNLSIKERGS